MNELDDMMKRGSDLAAAGDYTGALRIFTEACTAHPGSAAAWNNRGGAAYLCDDPAASAEAYREALRLDPGNAAAVTGLARAALRRMQWQEAVDLLESQEGPEPRYLLGIAHEALGNHDGAECAFMAAADAGHRQAHPALLRLYARLDQPQKLARRILAAGRPDIHAVTASLQNLPHGRSRWMLLETLADAVPPSPVLYDAAAGVFLHQHEYAYALRTLAAAGNRITGLDPQLWPSLKECACLG